MCPSCHIGLNPTLSTSLISTPRHGRIVDYYARYRPGLGSVLVFLSVLSALVQYAIQHLTRFSEVQRIKR